MFHCYYANGEFFRSFRRLKDAKKACASKGVSRIVSIRNGKFHVYWLGVDY